MGELYGFWLEELGKWSCSETGEGIGWLKVAGA